jgi:thiol-disulfide isomerase/thioredoxin
MIKIIISLLSCFFVFNSFGQTLKHIMDNYFAQIGGAEKIAIVNASEEISFNWFRISPSDDPEKAKPIRTMTVLKYPCYRRFVSYDSKGNWDNEFYYNEKGLVSARGSFIEKKTGQIQISVCVASDLLNWYTKNSLKYNGEDTINGKTYFVISKDVDNDTQFFFFNKDTHLLDASKSKNWPYRITYYRDYKRTNLILQPYLLESYQNDVIYYRQITEHYKFNPEIDMGIFYFNKNDYEKRNEPSIKYQNTRLDVKESEFPEFIKVNFSNSRVFIDVWATWCAPCKKEFRNYDSVYYDFMGRNNIHLVYLSIDKDADKGKWEKDISKLGLKGYHARVNRKLLQSIQTLIYAGKTVVIPRYILINEEGKILSVDFKRPSDPLFKDEINKSFGMK